MSNWSKFYRFISNLWTPG